MKFSVILYYTIIFLFILSVLYLDVYLKIHSDVWTLIRSIGIIALLITIPYAKSGLVNKAKI
jgi:hypothetical protein